jgi:hypothetical protein
VSSTNGFRLTVKKILYTIIFVDPRSQQLSLHESNGATARQSDAPRLHPLLLALAAPPSSYDFIQDASYIYPLEWLLTCLVDLLLKTSCRELATLALPLIHDIGTKNA